MGFYVAGIRRNYYTNPVEDALVLWRDEERPAQEHAGEPSPAGHLATGR